MLMLETEDSSFFEGQQREVGIDFWDPVSKASLSVVEELMDLISNGRACLLDLSIELDVGVGEDKYIYDPKGEEYRLSDGRYMYVIPRSVVMGQTNVVGKRRDVPRNFFLGFVNENVFRSTGFMNRLTRRKESVEWGSRDVLKVSWDVIEKMRQDAEILL